MSRLNVATLCIGLWSRRSLYLQLACTCTLPLRRKCLQFKTAQLTRPCCRQVPGALGAAGEKYGGVILGVTVLKTLIAWLAPDLARTVRMWRQFLPIYLRCRWTKWRYQEARGYTVRVSHPSVVMRNPLHTSYCSSVAVAEPSEAETNWTFEFGPSKGSFSWTFDSYTYTNIEGCYRDQHAARDSAAFALSYFQGKDTCSFRERECHFKNSFTAARSVVV